MLLNSTAVFATCFLYFAVPGIQAQRQAPSRALDTDRLALGFVFGIDLDTKGARSAVSLPDGRLVPLAAVEGSQDYVDLMRSWYEICTTANASLETKTKIARTRYPPPSPDEIRSSYAEWHAFEDNSPRRSGMLGWLQGLLVWRPKDQELLYAQTYFQDDKAVETLSSTLSELYDASRQALENLTTIPIPRRPYTEITLPGWMFANVPVFGNDDDLSAVDKSTLVSSTPYHSLTERFSVAAHRAGFRRSVNEQPGEVMELHSRGEHFEGPPPAPSMAIRASVNGTCGMSPMFQGDCTLKSRENCIPRPLVAVIDYHSIDETDFFLLWLQECLGPEPGFMRWRSWNVSANSDNHEAEQAHILETIAGEIQSATKGLNGFGRVDFRGAVPLVLTGQPWLDGAQLQDFLTSPLMRNTSVDVIRGEQHPHLAAISAAEVARYEWFRHNVHHMESDFYPEIFRENREAPREL